MPGQRPDGDERPSAGPGNNWRAAVLTPESGFYEGRKEVHENYCFECGSYTEIDDVTRLCVRCYRSWLDRRPPRG